VHLIIACGLIENLAAALSTQTNKARMPILICCYFYRYFWWIASRLSHVWNWITGSLVME